MTVPQATPYLPPGTAAAGEMGSVQAPVSIPTASIHQGSPLFYLMAKSIKVHST